MGTNELAKVAIDLGGAFSGERIKYALEMTGLGLLAVFSVLALIWAVLAIFKFFLYDLANKKKNSASTEAPQKIESAPAEVVKVENNTNDDATVAAIIAAISAYIAEDSQLSEQYANGFRVVSFKRVREKASWNSKNN